MSGTCQAEALPKTYDVDCDGPPSVTGNVTALQLAKKRLERGANPNVRVDWREPTFGKEGGTARMVAPAATIETLNYAPACGQHGEAACPPRRTRGEQVDNPVPQREVMRALMRGLHLWASQGVAPPESRYPKLADGTLTPIAAVKFPTILSKLRAAAQDLVRWSPWFTVNSLLGFAACAKKFVHVQAIRNLPRDLHFRDFHAVENRANVRVGSRARILEMT